MTVAAVVGSGPNGLVAAVVLAHAGVDVEVFEAADTIGGGARSAELTIPGVLHDCCSAIHPFGVASPAFRRFAPELERYGLEWAWPEVDLAHPVDGGDAGVLLHSLDDTVAGLGSDGDAWRRLYGPLAARFDDLVADTFGPLLRVPGHPIGLARLGTRALQPATWVARRWTSEAVRGLFAGIAAHTIHPLSRPGTAAAGLMLGAAAHAVGWPVAIGGSQSIADALAGIVDEYGGTITTGRRITSIDEVLGSDLGADVVLLDVAPGAAADLLGDRLPARVARAYRRYRHGPAAFKVDLAVDGGVPWTNERCRQAGTVHLGGTIEAIAVAEHDVHRGRMPERPFVLVGQQYVADPSRSAGDVHPVWAYCHVPAGYRGDATEAIVGQIERHAPGFGDRIVATATRSAAQIEADNANFVGGDIATGGNDLRQLLARPRVAVNPYATGVPGVYLCSAATPPGGGVHGMCGYNAAHAALRAL